MDVSAIDRLERGMVSSLKRKIIIVDRGFVYLVLRRWRYLTPVPEDEGIPCSQESIAEALRAVLQHIKKRIVGKRTVQIGVGRKTTGFLRSISESNGRLVAVH